MSAFPKVIAVVGPTASGKTALSIELAKSIGGEIISADSRQVYAGLDIGTGKVTQEEMQGVPHHLLDVADPKKIFTVADFVTEGRKSISEIVLRKHAPLIVGGTGFYVDALLGKIQIPEVAQNAILRAELKEKPLQELQKELEKLDPEKAETIDMQNPVRLVRAIEIARVLGKVPPSMPQKMYDVLWLGVSLPMQELGEKISTRLHARMQAGMLAEAQKLHAGGLSYERMEELGLEYRYMARHFEGKISEEEMLTQLETEITKYAKRQMTWFKRNKEIQWFSPAESANMLMLAKDFLKN